jgi:hypothetical protein
LNEEEVCNKHMDEKILAAGNPKVRDRRRGVP